MKNYKTLLELTNKILIQNVSCLIEHILDLEQDEPTDFYDNIYSKPKYHEGLLDHFNSLNKAEQKEFKKLYGQINEMNDSRIEELCYILSIELDYYEPLEFWTINPLYKKYLIEEDEIVEDYFGLTIWGRRENNKRIIDDNLIKKIAIKLDLIK